MSSFRLLALLAVLWLSACGFEPMYAEKTTNTPLPAVEIANIPDRDGQFLRNQLIDRLYGRGRPANAAYELRFSPLEKNIVNLGIRKDATATRAQMQISTHMQLIDKNSGAVVLERTLKTTGAYNLLDNQLATLTTQQGTTENMLRDLGDSAVLEMSLYFHRHADAHP